MEARAEITMGLLGQFASLICSPEGNLSVGPLNLHVHCVKDHF